jgi:hypothetical protein
MGGERLQGQKKKKSVIRITRPTLFFHADPTTFFFHLLKEKKLKKLARVLSLAELRFQAGRPNGDFRCFDAVPACSHVSNTKVIATFNEKFSVADVFREIHEDVLKGFLVTCVGQFGADSYDIDFASPLLLYDLRNLKSLLSF